MKQKCPIVKEECWEHGCTFYTHLLGKNPQTGVNEDKWGCNLNFLSTLLLENTQTNRQVVASMDRNNNTFFNALPPHLQNKVLNGSKKYISNEERA